MHGCRGCRGCMVGQMEALGRPLRGDAAELSVFLQEKPVKFCCSQKSLSNTGCVRSHASCPRWSCVTEELLLFAECADAVTRLTLISFSTSARLGATDLEIPHNVILERLKRSSLFTRLFFSRSSKVSASYKASFFPSAATSDSASCFCSVRQMISNTDLNPRPPAEGRHLCSLHPA